MKRLISRDPLSGVESWFEAEAMGGFIIHHTQDVTAIIERNKASQNDGTGGWGKSKEWRHAALIPHAALMMWAQDAGVQLNSKAFDEVVKKKLNDPDYRGFRTANFRV